MHGMAAAPGSRSTKKPAGSKSAGSRSTRATKAGAKGRMGPLLRGTIRGTDALLRLAFWPFRAGFRLARGLGAGLGRGSGAALGAAAGPAARGWRLLSPANRPFRWVLRIFVALLLLVAGMSFVNPVWTPYMLGERLRLGHVERHWVDMDEIAPIMARSVVAAEDANFCLHWGFDMSAIRKAIEDGRQRGASTISQQTVKNVFLWQGRSWPRKALEAMLTPLEELTWSKRRILEVYLNVAEFDEGVFGVEAAAQRYFKVSAKDLSPMQAARLAAILPDPKGRNAANLPGWLVRRARAITDGAATIRADGRAACFEH